MGEVWLGYETKAMHDGDIISAPYQTVLTLGLFIPFVACDILGWVPFCLELRDS